MWHEKLEKSDGNKMRCTLFTFVITGSSLPVCYTLYSIQKVHSHIRHSSTSIRLRKHFFVVRLLLLISIWNNNNLASCIIQNNNQSFLIFHCKQLWIYYHHTEIITTTVKHLRHFRFIQYFQYLSCTFSNVVLIFR